MGFGDKAITEEPLQEDMVIFLTGIKKKLMWLQEDRDLWKTRALKAKVYISCLIKVMHSLPEIDERTFIPFIEAIAKNVEEWGKLEKLEPWVYEKAFPSYCRCGISKG